MLSEELIKNGISVKELEMLSYKSDLGRSLVHGLNKFDKGMLFQEIRKVIAFYQKTDILDSVDMDYRIKSEDSCMRKYEKFYPEMRLEKVFNDLLGFRMLVNNYDIFQHIDKTDGFRIVDMSGGKANDDGYRGVHIYYQPTHFHYPIEIQTNTYYDRQMNNWLHKYVYKRGYSDKLGKTMRKEYETGKIMNEKKFLEVMNDVLSDS